MSTDRSFHAANSINRHMDDNSLKIAGLIFGSGHYKEIVSGLKEKNIGHAFYYPGKDAEADVQKYYADVKAMKFY